MKTIFNNSINKKNIGKEIEVYGWVQKKRNLGGLIFIDLRDRSGIVQLVVRPENKFYSLAETLKNEYVIKAIGKVVERESKNKNIATGDIEIDVTDLVLLNTSLDIPFTIDDETTALEDTRLKYRYLDLRRNAIKDRLILRSKVCSVIRNYLNDHDFIELETPILCKSTPEGARDFLVPSRMSKGSFYALPQSPQIFKQLSMIGGLERYYQIARCFRDEDLRADRQPEFTQLDLEMSFVDEDDVMTTVEGLIAHIFKEIKNIKIKLPLMRMKYNDAMRDYGSDKPDLRFGMKINDVNEVFKNTEFEMFKNAEEISCLVVENSADKFSRKQLDSLSEFVKTYGLKGISYLKIEDETTGSLAKALTDDEIKQLKTELKLKKNDLVLFGCGDYNTVKIGLGALRVKLGKDLELYSKDKFALLWIVDFPAFEYSEEEQRFVATHHPFTMPKDEDVDKLMTDKANCYSKAYDIVINGYEAGGGSIRIHDGEVQKKMFEALELTEAQIKTKFGFFVDALKYGTPPHGGIAFGLERWIMILSGTDNIRDVIAFPKTASGNDLMSECPNLVEKEQLDELGIKLK
ncbi:MAG: aspartate--tRNA ligase [Bacilli bacterium]|nr:aspartate--tRNA ligase [Bacilli bacterium]